MNSYTKILIFIFITIASTSCGFQTLDYKKIKNIHLNEISEEGNKSINFRIISDLKQLFSRDLNSIDKFDIHLKSKETISIKEKNKKNEITRYEITMECNLTIKHASSSEEININLVKSTDFRVGSKNLETIQREKKAKKQLIATLSDEIVENIVLKFNDL